MPLFTITTLGCKVNQYDSAAISQSLEQAGFEAAKPGQTADLVIINTCCVTAAAMQKSRYYIRRLMRQNPGACLLVSGCYSDFDAPAIKSAIAKLGIDRRKTFLCGHHGNLAETIKNIVNFFATGCAVDCSGSCGPAKTLRDENTAGKAICQTSTPHPDTIKTRRLDAVKRNISAGDFMPQITSYPGRQRAIVKIQDGCDAFCSYCVVPYTRSVLWSRDFDETIAQCCKLVELGFREIILSGVFLGAFGRTTAIRRKWATIDNPNRSSLAELVRKVAEIPGLWKVRLSSLEPLDVSDELLAVAKNCPQFAPHFHLPLQSGSDRILAKMNRQYSASDYRQMINRIRSTVTNPAITTDIIVGFPGETDEDHQQTLEMTHYAGFAKVHAFPFSAIEGTAAWHMRDQCPPQPVVKNRLTQLASAERQTSENFRQIFVGQTLEAVVEQEMQSSYYQAVTDRYFTLHFKPPAGMKFEDMIGNVYKFRAEKLFKDGMLAIIAEKP